MSKERYREIEHTADVRLEIFGADEGELFANAAFALFDRMADLSSVDMKVIDEVVAYGADAEETLINFLSELLYRFDGEGRIYRACRIEEIAPGRVRGLCEGEAFDPARHRVKEDIKAVTFHDVNISRGPRGLSVVVTFDV